MGKFKDKNGHSRISAILKSKTFKDVANFAIKISPIPSALIPDRNGDGKRNLKDLRWYEIAGSIGVLGLLVKLDILNFDQVLKLLQTIVE